MLNLHRPDPAWATSGKAKANFRLALRLSLTAVAVLWAIHLLNWTLDYQLNRYGILPRHSGGLIGLITAPLLHGSFLHLFNNSLPLIVLGTAMLHVYPNSGLRVLPMLYLGTGLAVWLLGRSSFHIGASGVIYGMLAFVFFSGVFKRDARGISLSILIFFLYGSMSWGILPQGGGISWESHLAGAVLGTLGALRYRNWDQPPRKTYDWEDDDDD